MVQEQQGDVIIEMIQVRNAVKVTAIDAAMGYVFYEWKNGKYDYVK